MSQLIRFALAALAAVWLGAAPARAEMDPAQKQEIEQVVRDYLMAHPEVIEDAINELRKRKQQEAAATQAKVINDKSSLIFDSANQMVLGNPQGKITLVEFFDYNCGYCRHAVSDLSALLKANPDLRVVMKEFPILSAGSVEAARISVAIKDSAPQTYWKFHQELFSRPGQATGDKAIEVARDLGLNADKLKTSAARGDVTDNLQEVQKLADALGISGTPSYVIGRELVPGAAGYDVLQQKVAAMRKCGATTC
jgi:protein-disulfide isomerase